MSSSADYDQDTHALDREHELDGLESSRRYPPLPVSPPLGRSERFPLSASASASSLGAGAGRAGGAFALSTGSSAAGAGGGGGGGGAGGLGRAFGSRMLRMARRGQLPFLLVFFACVIIFFTALTGLGYVDPDAVSSPATTLPDLDAPEVDFMPGQPVFDAGVAHAPGTSQEEVRRAEMRKLEQEWSRQKRPKDGAWMQKQRDQRAVRRKPLPNSPGERQRLARSAAAREGDEPLE